MPRIQFPIGSVGTESLPRTRRDLHNCFNTGEERVISRPGIEAITTITGVARGQFVWNEELYRVQSQELLKITDILTGATSVIGNIAGSAAIEFDVGFNEAVIVVRGGSIYTLSNSTVQIAITGVTDSSGIASFTHAGSTPAIGDSVTISGFTTNTAYNVTGIVTASTSTTFEISSVAFGTDETGQFTKVLTDISGNSNFVACVDVAYINGRFVYIPADGDPAFFSDVGDAGTVQALSFFDAEELPDKNNAVFSLKNTLYICGTDSIQPFSDTGATPVPFISIKRSRIDYGYIGGLLEYLDTFIFVGREKGQDQGIYAIAQGGATKLSNERIDLILSTYTESQLQDVISGRIKWRGYDIATFELGGDSFGFVLGNWILLSTLVSNTVVPWAGGFITQFQKEYYSAKSADFGKITKINTDYGDPIPKIIDTALEQAELNNFSVQSIELGISQGFNASVGSVAIRMSSDNITYSPYLYINLGAIGEYADKIVWNPPGGLGNYRGFAGIQFYSTENIEFAADYIVAKVR